VTRSEQECERSARQSQEGETWLTRVNAERLMYEMLANGLTREDAKSTIFAMYGGDVSKINMDNVNQSYRTLLGEEARRIELERQQNQPPPGGNDWRTYNQSHVSGTDVIRTRPRGGSNMRVTSRDTITGRRARTPQRSNYS
jgi:hypothetical protein